MQEKKFLTGEKEINSPQLLFKNRNPTGKPQQDPTGNGKWKEAEVLIQTLWLTGYT